MSKHFTSVDQSDRLVPYNLRQSGETPVEMLIFTRVRKSPFWHLSGVQKRVYLINTFCNTSISMGLETECG